MFLWIDNTWRRCTANDKNKLTVLYAFVLQLAGQFRQEFFFFSCAARSLVKIEI